MADEIAYKKMYRKADEHLKDRVPVAHGKKANQKMKPYIVLQYLMKHTDENHVESAYDIIAYLESQIFSNLLPFCITIQPCDKPI